MGTAIKAADLTKTFGDKQAVKGISFEIEEGEIYGFLGPNGAGKSTTIRMLVTLTEPTTGDAWIFGSSVKNNEDGVRLKIGVALQEAALDEQQTGIEFLKLQAKLYGIRGEDITSRLESLTKLVDIGDALGDRIKTYSGGMKRRLDLAAALIHNPKVLFLDEPTTGLDPTSRNRVWEEIRRLNKDLGMTIFLTTQYLEEADQLANRVAIIDNGVLRAQGTPTELKKTIGNDIVSIRLSEDNSEIRTKLLELPSVTEVEQQERDLTISMVDASKHISELITTLAALGQQPEELSIRTPSLDDVFLKVTGSRLKEEK